MQYIGVCWHKDVALSPNANANADWARNTAFAVNDAKFGGSNSTLPSSTVFKMGDNAEINPSSKSVLFYAFRSIPGVCVVSSYTGNGNAGGPYISTGFLPRWIMIKQSSSTGSWQIYDTARSPFNEVDDQLLADSAAAETTGSEELDILADGFKIKTTDSGVNASGNLYIYLAMADIGGNGTLPPIYSQ